MFEIKFDLKSNNFGIKLLRLLEEFKVKSNNDILRKIGKLFP